MKPSRKPAETHCETRGETWWNPTLVEPIVEPEEKPEVELVFKRPPLNMLRDTLDDCEALSCKTRSETRV